MKLTTLFTLMTIFQLYASDSYSQLTRISLKVENDKISDVLKKIEDKSEYYFLYSPKLINVNKRVSINAKDEPIKNILNGIFDEDVKFEVYNHQIILSKEGITPVSVVEQLKNTVTGKVTTEKGEPIPGVSVVVKVTTTGTVTDVNGNYTLSLPDNAKILEFSFIGMTSQEITIGAQTVINVVLTEAAVGLNEVVVVGYGTMKKSDLTGAVVKADIKSFRESSNVNILQSLKGAVAGLNVSQTVGAGQDPLISIRGNTSISGSQTPLIVLDGIIYRGSMNDINPNDIESIDILKDASSSAIYGSEAANGVIMVTTKAGQGDGKPIISYSGSYSFQSPTKVLHPGNLEQFKQKNLDADWRNSMLAPDYTTPNPNYVNTHFLSNAAKEGWDNGVDTDWWGLNTLDHPYVQDHNLSIRAKTQKTNYFISTGYTDQKNLIVNDKYKRNTLRINIDNTITNWLTVGVKTFLTVSDFSGASADLRQIHILAPIAKAYGDNGQIITEPYWGGILSPLLRKEMDDLEKRTNIDGNFYADIYNRKNEM